MYRLRLTSSEPNMIHDLVENTQKPMCVSLVQDHNSNVTDDSGVDDHLTIRTLYY